MNILGTGLSGLIGSRVIELLEPAWSFQNLSLETGVDITNRQTVDDAVLATNASWVFHFAAFTDVDGAEREKDKGARGSVWQINVTATEYLVEACRKEKKHLLYISTDFVFDGEKESYSEDDIPNPISWYAQTKYEGEKRVLSLGDDALVVRIANPYRANPSGKKDFVHRIIDILGEGTNLNSPTDQSFVPTFIDDITHAIKTLVEKDAHGVYHVVGSQAESPYRAAKKIARVYSLDSRLVRKITFAEYFRGRAQRPIHAVLKNDKIASFGIQMNSFDDGLAVVYAQESNRT